MAFSPRAVQAIEAFASSLDLPAPRPAPDGSYSFVFARSGTLTFTSAGDGERVLASLSKRPSRLNEDVEHLVLAAAGPDVTTQRCLSAGLARDGSVVFAVSIDEGELNLPVVETCLQQLMAAQAAVA